MYKRILPARGLQKSLAKTVSWRVLGTLDTLAISFILTGKWQLALSIGGIEVFSKMVLYFIHERLWESKKQPTHELSS